MIKTTDLVLIVENFHDAQCSRPPEMHSSAADGDYVGYFVNQFGEQWLVCIDPETQNGTLRGGDLGWEQAISIVEGHLADDLILGGEEHQWLDACWRAACGQPLAD